MPLPYQFGMLMASYVHQRCHLCGVNYSQKIFSEPTSNRHHKSHHYKNFLKPLKRFDTGVLCEACHNAIAWSPKRFELVINRDNLPVYPASLYQHPIDAVIRRFKFNEDMTQLPVLVHLIQQLSRPYGCHSSNTIILPMPTTKPRLKRRGFDPVSVLVPYLSKHWGIPIWQGVVRIDDSDSQRGLSRIERLNNLNGAFVVTKPMPKKRILLFDDVVTTGATMTALANAIVHTWTPPIRKSHNMPQLQGFCLAYRHINGDNRFKSETNDRDV